MKNISHTSESGLSYWASGAGDAGLVSIVVPTYNRAAPLLELLDSIRNQSYRPIEVVIVDDGSTDDSFGLASSWALRSETCDFSVIYVHQSNMGVCHARNNGCHHSNGEYVVFVDSDDIFTEDSIEVSVNAAHQHNSPFVYSKTLVTDYSMDKVLSTIGAAQMNLEEDLVGYLWHTMGPLYRRSTLINVGPWNTDLPSNNDWEYGCRVRIAGHVGTFVDHVGGYFRQHNLSRIGVKRYSAAYTTSLHQAVLSVYKIADIHMRLSPGLVKVLSKRLLIHAIEAQAMGDSLSSTALLKSASNITLQLRYRLFNWILRNTPYRLFAKMVLIAIECIRSLHKHS